VARRSEDYTHIYVTYASFWELIIANANGGQWAPSAKFSPLAQISSYPKKDFASLQNLSSAALSCATSIKIYLKQKIAVAIFLGDN